MATSSCSKFYTIDHAWQSGRDLKIKCLGEPVYHVIFHTERIGNTCSLSIHDKGLGGAAFCAGVLDRNEGFSYKTSGQREKHYLQKRDGFTIWDQQYQFKPAQSATLAWKQARPGEPGFSMPDRLGDDVPALRSRDWVLVAVNEDDGTERHQPNAPDKVLAVYSAPRGISQQARMSFMEELGRESEVGALAVVLGIVRWNYAKPAKMLASAFSSAPAFSG